MRALILIMTALLAVPAWAQEDSMKDLPGYVDFGPLTALLGEPSVEIAVGQTLLGLVASFSEDEEPESADLFRRLKGVRIQVFETAALDAAANAGALDQVQKISSSLSDAGWEPVIKVSSPDEQMRMFMKINGKVVEGITVMSLDGEEATFINVIGDIDPAQLDKVMDNFEFATDHDADKADENGSEDEADDE